MNVLTEEHRPNKANSTSKPIQPIKPIQPVEPIKLIKPVEPIKGRTYDRQTIHKGTMVNSLRGS
jgi:hypothetical protein